MSSVSAVFVNWHSSRLLHAAISSARAACSAPLEVIVVDNSCDPAEEERVRAVGADEVIVAPANEGYGAGVNRGAALARGEWLILSNPDVVYGEAAIDQLLAVLRGGASVAGPRFIWDAEGKWLLPPADAVSLSGKLWEVLATRSVGIRRVRDRGRARRRMEFWSRTHPSRESALSGAVLATKRSLFESLGGFDERFHLYFEETDLVRRVERAGGTAMHVPGAVVRHLYNQSGMRREDREAVYLRSESLFYRKWYRSDFMLRLARSMRGAPAEAGHSQVVPRDAAWFEASPEPYFLSAAGRRAADTLLIPDEISETLGGRPLWLRAVDAGGNELVRWRAAAAAAPFSA